MSSLFSKKEKLFFGMLLGLVFIFGGLFVGQVVTRSRETKEKLQSLQRNVDEARAAMLTSYQSQFQVLESWLEDKKMLGLLTQAGRSVLEAELPGLKQNQLLSAEDLQIFDLQLITLTNLTSRVSSELIRAAKKDPEGDLSLRFQDLLRADHNVNRARAAYVQVAFEYNLMIEQTKLKGGKLTQRLVGGEGVPLPIFESDRLILEARLASPSI